MIQEKLAGILKTCWMPCSDTELTSWWCPSVHVDAEHIPLAVHFDGFVLNTEEIQRISNVAITNHVKEFPKADLPWEMQMKAVPRGWAAMLQAEPEERTKGRIRKGWITAGTEKGSHSEEQCPSPTEGQVHSLLSQCSACMWGRQRSIRCSRKTAWHHGENKSPEPDHVGAFRPLPHVQLCDCGQFPHVKWGSPCLCPKAVERKKGNYECNA